MKRDLRSSKGTAQPIDPEMLQSVDPQQLQDAQSAVEHYGSMNEAQLMQELKGFRDAGVMDDEALANMARQVSPMLTPEQQARLGALLTQLRQ
ncbi:MAG: hypothetical protein Q4E65_00220 [Clostridia bacterium]|nr:hypothetical protein [Clostridia bacterium]